MTIAASRTFKSGNSEAVRLPRNVAFGQEIEVTIVRSGDVLTIFPKKASMPELLARLAALPVPTEIEVRDTDPLPEPSEL